VIFSLPSTEAQHKKIAKSLSEDLAIFSFIAVECVKLFFVALYATYSQIYGTQREYISSIGEFA